MTLDDLEREAVRQVNEDHLVEVMNKVNELLIDPVGAVSFLHYMWMKRTFIRMKIRRKRVVEGYTESTLTPDQFEKKYNELRVELAGVEAKYPAYRPKFQELHTFKR